jgi:glycosyltransferase involved in cell wall biosynthesis
MKLLMVITRGDEAGGAQIHLRELCRGLVHAGNDVYVVAGSGGMLTDELDAMDVPYRICPPLLREIHPLRDIRAVAELRQIIREVRPDLVCAHSTKAGIVGRLAAKLSGVPAVFTAHGWTFIDAVPQPQRTIYRLLERAAAPLASRVICVSEHDRAIGIAAGIPARRLVTIHNGMPDIAVEPPARPNPGAPVRIVMVARFATPKDHRTVIEAMSGVPGAVLDLVGDGPDLPSVRSLVSDLGMDDRVTFLGNRNDVPTILKGSDIFVLSSDREGFPLSTLEAMRAGLPVVVSDVGGAPEAVVPGTTGFLVAARDVAGFRDALNALVREPERRETMGRAGRAKYLSDFTFATMLAKTRAVYDAVLAEHRRPVRATRHLDDRAFELMQPVAISTKDTTGGTELR